MKNFVFESFKKFLKCHENIYDQQTSTNVQSL